MSQTLKYHFSIHLNFKKDVDVEKLEKHFGIEAYKLTKLSESKGSDKSAKIWYRTEEFDNIMLGDCFDNFVEKVKDKFVDLPQILEKYDGECGFAVVINEMQEIPAISLSKQTIQTLSKLGADYSIDLLID